MNDPACVTLYGRLLDKFGDNGIVTALIGRQTGDALDIELWIRAAEPSSAIWNTALFDRLVDVCPGARHKNHQRHLSSHGKELVGGGFLCYNWL